MIPILMMISEKGWRISLEKESQERERIDVVRELGKRELPFLSCIDLVYLLTLSTCSVSFVEQR
jgi:hypothetical protein